MWGIHSLPSSSLDDRHHVSLWPSAIFIFTCLVRSCYLVPSPPLPSLPTLAKTSSNRSSVWLVFDDGLDLKLTIH